MLNLISMNLYRLLKCKGAYITIIIAILLFALLGNILTDPEEQAMDSQIIEEQGLDIEESSGIGMTITSYYNEEAKHPQGLDIVYNDIMSSGLLLMLIGIFAAAYTNEERDSGFLKNLPMGSKQKGGIFLAKVTTIFAYSFFIILVTIFATKIGIIGRTAEVNQFYDLPGFVKYVAFQVFLHTAFATFVMFVFELCRNMLVTVICTIVVSVNVIGSVFSWVEGNIASFGTLAKRAVEYLGIVQYMIVTRVQGMNVCYATFPHVNSLVVGIIGIALYATLGAIVFSKKDVY
ncbi:MAG: ABC transporter permease [Lachnospiraceae bacterium]|nr:ABC transporter permease [Candidatus Colinaster equi]